MQFNQIEPLYSFLSQEISTKEMPIKLSYKFSKLLTSVNTEFEFYQKKVSEILQKYGQKDDKGDFIVKDGSIPFQEEYKEIASNQFEDLCKLEVTLPEIKFTLEELDCLTLTPQQVTLLLPFITE